MGTHQIEAAIERAAKSVRQAYEFNSNSYTASALSECFNALVLARDVGYSEGWCREFLNYGDDKVATGG